MNGCQITGQPSSMSLQIKVRCEQEADIDLSGRQGDSNVTDTAFWDNYTVSTESPRVLIFAPPGHTARFFQTSH